MPLSETITLSEVLKRMRELPSFCISYVSYNKRKKTGGVIKELAEAVTLGKLNSSSNTSNFATPSKNANHKENLTMNIQETIMGIEQGHPIKIHIYLITKFEGKKVILG